MRRKARFAVLIIASLMILVGCSNDKNNEKLIINNTKSESTKEDNEVNKSQAEDLFGIEVVPMYKHEGLNKKGEVGSIKYKITDIQVYSGKVENEQKAMELDVLKGEYFTVLTFFGVFENKADKIVEFYPSSSSLTGLNLNGDEDEAAIAYLIDNRLDENYVAKDKKEGSFYFVLRNTKVEDLKEVKLNLSVPFESHIEKPEIQFDIK